MSSEGSFTYESLQDCESIQRYLTILQEGFASGKLRLSVRDEELLLEPSGLIEFTLEAKKKGDRRKVTLKLSWKDEEKAAPEDAPLIMESE